MAILTIGGEAIPSPSELKVSIFQVGSDETRSASGMLVSDRIAEKRRLNLRWAHLTPAQLGALLGKVGAAFFQATYPDPKTMAVRTMTCHCGECGAGVLRMVDGAPVWTDVEMEWVEK